MIKVFVSEDNNFEANSDCKMHVLILLRIVLGKPFKITITIDRDQA